MKNKMVAISIALVAVILIVAFGRIFLIRTIEERYETAPVRIQEGEIIGRSALKLGSSILSINETKIKSTIESCYEDRSVVITDIERIFPNKVVIYIMERLPIAAVASGRDAGKYALADIDFQYNKVMDGKDVDFAEYIKISGTSIEYSFNTDPFRTVREVFMAFRELNIPEYALPKLLEEVFVTDNYCTVVLRDGTDFSVSTDTESLRESIKYSYLEIG